MRFSGVLAVVPAWLAMLPVPGLAQGTPADGLRTDRVTNCRFLVPDEIAPGASFWEGDCPNHLAEGPGVIRVSLSGHKPEMFAGVMHAGQPVQGLVDLGDKATSDYGPAFRFEGAHAIAPTTHDQMATGFKAASDGAAEASRRFLYRGNTGSAKFYADWSHALAKAPDQNE